MSQYQRGHDRRLFGSMLRKEFLHPCGISQRRLAEASDELDPGTLSRMITGSIHITVEKRREHARKILKGLYKLGCLKSLEQANGLLNANSPEDILQENNEEDTELIQNLKASMPKLTPYLTRHLTPLLGRDKTIEDICNKLRDPRVHLLTLVGPSGIGKTELARQIQEQLRKDFSPPPIFVELDRIDDPALVFSTIIECLQLNQAGTRSPLESLMKHLKNEHQLIILDNFEQVMKVREKIAELVEVCPKVKMLVTSLERLNVHIENVFDVDPLPVPDPEYVSGEKDLLQYPATELFIERAKANDHKFKIDGREAPIIAKICQCLDGMPGAIEITAPDITLLSPNELLQEVQEQLLHLSSSAPVDTPRRQRTQEAMIAYSYNRFDP